MNRLLFLLFFLSGFSALVYEIVWARQLSLIFGTTTASISSILAVFFLGLAIGSWLFGRLVDHANGMRMGILRIDANARINPLLLYGVLEAGIGVYAIFTPFIFKLIENFGANVLLSSFMGLILPTVLMGGTFPVIAKAVNANAMRIKIARMDTNERMGRDISILYGVNTVGAGLGAFMAGFILIASFGVRETIFFAAGINLFIAGVVVYANKLQMPIVRIDANISKHSQNLNSHQISILSALFLTGFSALSLEVLWTRVLILFFGASVYAFSIVLAAFLIGIALGSFVNANAMRMGIVRINANNLFGGLVMVLGLGVILSIPLFGELPFWILGILKGARGSFAGVVFWEAVLAFLIMIVPTALMGFIFPLGVDIFMRIKANKERMNANERIGNGVGMAYSVNTFGGIFGALTAGFLLIPLVGAQKGIWIAGSIYLITGGVIFLLTQPKKPIRILISCFIILTILIGFVMPSWNKQFLISGPYANWRSFIFDTREQAEKRMQASEIIFYKEGLESVVAVKKSGENLSLRINGKTDAATGADMDTQILSGQLPMLFHPNPKDVLVIGLGSGVSLGSVETHPASSIEAVEIEPAVIEAAKLFNKVNGDALNDPRLKMAAGDGRNYLLRGAKKYDVITSEPSNVWLSGNSKLFTKEYFLSAKKRLKKGGIMAHWIQLYSLNEEDLKTAIKTFSSVFPYTTVWDNISSYDLLIVGSQEPLIFDFSSLEEKFKRERIRNDLGRIFIENPAQLLSYLALDNDGVLKYSAGVKENTDNNPTLEFSAPKSLYSATISKNLESLSGLRPNLYPQNSLFKKYFDARGHIVSGKTYFTRGETQKAVAEYEKALVIDPQNGWLKQVLSELKR